MARITMMRLLAAAVLIAAETAVVAPLLMVAPTPANAQRFEDFFPFLGRNTNRRGWFAPPEREERAVDYSRAPAPKKSDAVPQTPIMVFGDSMADWLAYGLEQAYTDTPEIGVLRRHRTSSGLIRTDVKNDPRGEYPDWPLAAKEMIAAQKPKFVVMMIGLNDRKQIREAAQPVRAKPPAPANPEASDPAARELDGAPTPRPAPEAAAAAPEPAIPGGIKTYEFRTDAWSEAYIRRIDDTIAALKTAGVPIFWVGLPPLRGGRAGADVPFLNDLYRSRADKAGIVYVDVWDGFVDEDGRFAQSGPDFEGQTRRLRAGDGVHFTQSGARKLAHFVEKEIDRWLDRACRRGRGAGRRAEGRGSRGARDRSGRRTGQGGPVQGEAALRTGPAVALRFRRDGRTAGWEAASRGDRRGRDQGPGQGRGVAGAGRPRRRLRVAAAYRGAGRRRSRRRHDRSAETPMVAERGSTPAAAAAPEAATAVAAAAPAAAKPAPRRVRSADYQPQYRPDYRRQQQFNFFPFLFGGGR